ncbi:hypothetical protein IHE45_18G033400 [Dioscorea alata]|uniref:Uncharacterized protein n=1 Tax=Dioscorea alata TaxID=55571 RepID=A0ACB7U631_DIOAL|nr:hypothetical protein IHE45_18G033400 [Dioscorea alata]
MTHPSLSFSQRLTLHSLSLNGSSIHHRNPSIHRTIHLNASIDRTIPSESSACERRSPENSVTGAQSKSR